MLSKSNNSLKNILSHLNILYLFLNFVNIIFGTSFTAAGMAHQRRKIMSKNVFLFSGQGSQYAGMGKELCENFKTAKDIYNEASENFGFDVLKLSCEGSGEELAQTAVSQPLIYTLSMAAYSLLRENGIAPDAVAGFSIGEVSALTAAEAIDLKTGFKVIKERAAAMQAAAESSESAMYAVIGLENEEVEKTCSEIGESTGGYVVPVNYNCKGQIVIAGEEAAAKTAAEKLGEKSKKVVRLAVNAAFHSKLMNSASERFYENIKGFAYGTPKVTVYSNVTGGKAEIDDVAGYLKKQMISPVKFSDEMAAMSRDGIDTFVELGPGKTLCGFIRRGLKGLPFYNVEDLKSFEKCLEAFGKNA